MTIEKPLNIKKLNPFIYLLDEAGEATGYLVIGEEKACVIDTMNGHNDIFKAVRTITDKPLILINTHWHWDHICGNIYFEKAFIHRVDKEIAMDYISQPDFIKWLNEKGKKMPPFEEITGGDVFDLGGKTLEVIELPGHTPGSILLLLREDRILFTGDAVNHHLWMQLDGCLTLKEYVKELDKIMYLEDKADYILHGHASGFDDISLIKCLRNGIEEICDGKTENDKPYTWSGGTCMQHSFTTKEGKTYERDDNVIVYLPDHIK